MKQKRNILYRLQVDVKTCQRSIIGIKSLYNHNGYKESFNFNN